MTKEEFYQLHDMRQRKPIQVTDLENQEPRTLIYGYQLNRDTFSLLLVEKDGVLLFRRKVYSYPKIIVSDVFMSEIHPEHSIPDKRVYPDRSDFEFCLLLQQQGIEIPFTTFG